MTMKLRTLPGEKIRIVRANVPGGFQVMFPSRYVHSLVFGTRAAARAWARRQSKRFYF